MIVHTKKYLFLVILSVCAVLTAQAEDLFFTYYNNWCMGYDNSWSLAEPYRISTKTYAQHLGNTTHVIVFMGYEIIKSDYSPYFSIAKEYSDNGGSVTDSIDFLWNGAGNPNGGYADWVTRGGIEALRDSLHAKGKKILVCLQGVNASIGYNYVASDSARTEVFTKAVAGYVNRHNFDGADLNIENSITVGPAEHERFFRILRRNMPSPKLITCVPPVWPTSTYSAGTIQHVDYVLPQCYAYVSNWQVNPTCGGGAGNGVFLKAPLHKDPNPSGSNHQDITTWGPNQWYQAGWPKSKIVILLSNEANVFTTGDSLFACAGWMTPFWPDTGAYAMLSRGGTLVWDNSHVGSYIKGTATSSLTCRGITINTGDKFIIPVLSNRNMDSVVAWGKANGYNNFGLYDVSTDARTLDVVKTPRHAYLSSLLNPGPPPPPVPTGTFTATPDTLPVGGGTVTLSWSSSDALTASIDQGIGVVSLSGSRNIVVTSSTTFSLTLVNTNGSQSYPATVTIVVPPPTGTLTASPSSLPVGGGNVTLSWSSVNATGASLNQGIGQVQLNGSTTVFVASTKIFTLTLSNARGSVNYSAPVTVAGSVVQQLSVYTDNVLPAPWTTDGSWGGSNDFANTEQVYGGTSSIKGTYNGWAALFLRSGTWSVPQPVNPVGYDSLRFAIRSSNSPIQMVTRLGDASGEFSAQYSYTAPATGWLPVSIPVLALNPQSLPFLTISFYVNQASGCSFYVDEISFVGQGVVPTGTFSVTPDSLPAGGGSATLSWTSSNAQAASIDNGVGSVSLSGSHGVTVGSTTTLILTLSNQSGSRQYSAHIGVALPGGQGRQDITSQGIPIALITNPTGAGNHDIEVIRDGNTPPVGSTNVLEQYDTFTGGSPRPFEWIGYDFASTKAFSGATYQEGLDNQWGGSFETLRVQVRTNGTWMDVQNLQSTPPYVGANGINYETYELSFNPIAGDAVRIAGTPTGTAHYVGVGELRVFDTQGLLVNAPQLVVPNDGSSNQPLTPVMRWGSMQNALGYHLQVSTDSAFVSLVLDDAQISDTLRQVNGLAQSTKYFWHVKSRCGIGEGNYSTPWGFTTLAGVPAVPTLVSPLNGAINLPVLMQLRWRSSSGAASYHIQVSTTSSFTSTIYNDSTVVDTVSRALSLSNQVKYYWRVRAKNAGGASGFSAAWNFTTIPGLPTPPVLSSPVNNSPNQSLLPTLKWSQTGVVALYHLQVSPDSAFSTVIVNDSSITTNYKRIGGLSNSAKYFWRVRSRNAAGFSSFSSRWCFTTKQGRVNVTSSGSPVAFVQQPVGGGNTSLEVIRDGIVPQLGDSNLSEQYDTYTGIARQFDWIGYTFGSAHRWSNLEFQEGVESDSGGWFASLSVQVRVNGNWVDVHNLTTIPQYVPNNGISFESYDFNFDSIVGDGIRIAGIPGGTRMFVSVAELHALDDDSSLTTVKSGESIPWSYELRQNYPNPFNPSTIINYQLPMSNWVLLKVFDVLGREVETLVNEVKQPGAYLVQWNANSAASGVYFYRLSVGEFSETKRMLLMK